MHLNKGMKTTFRVERSKRPPERAYSSIPNRIYPFINCCFAKKWNGLELNMELRAGHVHVSRISASRMDVRVILMIFL